MGTSSFAVPSLKALKESGYNIPLVVTQPDRPKGRGCLITAPPVKEAALSLNLEVLQTESVKQNLFLEKMESLSPDFLIVAAFGHILPASVLKVPKIASLNIHGSILPKYRGPAPIQWAIINGEKETGVTIMIMNEGLDTGDILISSKTEITSSDTSYTLSDKLSYMGADLLISVLDNFPNLKPIPQDNSKFSYAPLFRKKDGCINWSKSAEEIDAFIRGVTPWPGAYTFHNKKLLKIFKATPLEIEHNLTYGTILKSQKSELCIAAGKGAIKVLELQGSSGKRLKTNEFLCGCKMPEGCVLR